MQRSVGSKKAKGQLNGPPADPPRAYVLERSSSFGLMQLWSFVAADRGIEGSSLGSQKQSGRRGSMIGGNQGGEERREEGPSLPG